MGPLCSLLMNKDAWARSRPPGPAFPASQMDNLTAVFRDLLAACPKEVSVWKSPALRGRSHTAGLESVGNSSLSRGCYPPTTAPTSLRYQQRNQGQLVVGGSPYGAHYEECVRR